MGKYTTLTDMGVTNPKQIARYTIHIVDNNDVLRIVYSRKKGDLLPLSKTFKFSRIKKSVLVDSGTRKTQVIFESAPIFTNAVKELNEIVDKNDNADQLNQILEDEVLQLEAEMTSRISYIKSLIERKTK